MLTHKNPVVKRRKKTHHTLEKGYRMHPDFEATWQPNRHIPPIPENLESL